MTRIKKCIGPECVNFNCYTSKCKLEEVKINVCDSFKVDHEYLKSELSKRLHEPVLHRKNVVPVVGAIHGEGEGATIGGSDAPLHSQTGRGEGVGGAAHVPPHVNIPMATSPALKQRRLDLKNGEDE